MSVSDLDFFAHLARKENLSEAALELYVTPSAVSRRLGRLEDRLGVKLVNRSTRTFALTAEGEAYYATALDILGRIRTAEDKLRGAPGELTGVLRVNATIKFGRTLVAPIVSEFVKLHPGVHVQLILSDTAQNLVQNGYDLGIRLAPEGQDAEVSRRLLGNRRYLCASPDYLRRAGTPTRLSQLIEHNCITLRQQNEAFDSWNLESDGEIHSVRVKGTLNSNDGDVALSWTVAAHGIMLRSEWDIAPLVAEGRLSVIMPKYSQNGDVIAVTTKQNESSDKVWRFVDLLSEALERHARIKL
ncbi:LysR family transcriptional regulator [Puniceibacterium sp. IMCC21224]|uniref:LysR family transcriptional regulator n=1 Tax=Puniceibacterium sp. IMCC21224 TaxID=1618204 RepID=UPI00064D9BC5|nr:LysR family transcriptional regulator [Puniceibacterium sp. IMCC21224]KMK69083.1 transcriptional regulator [Puniceibacterium sp. IMCC21224]